MPWVGWGWPKFGASQAGRAPRAPWVMACRQGRRGGRRSDSDRLAGRRESGDHAEQIHIALQTRPPRPCAPVTSCTRLPCGSGELRGQPVGCRSRRERQRSVNQASRSDTFQPLRPQARVGGRPGVAWSGSDPPRAPDQATGGRRRSKKTATCGSSRSVYFVALRSVGRLVSPPRMVSGSTAAGWNGLLYITCSL